MGAINISQAESPAAAGSKRRNRSKPRAFQQQATEEPAANANISALGSVEADTVVPLYFQASGTVQGVYVQIGDFVQAGDVLADLERLGCVEQLQSGQAEPGKRADFARYAQPAAER